MVTPSPLLLLRAHPFVPQCFFLFFRSASGELLWTPRPPTRLPAAGSGRRLAHDAAGGI